MKPIHTDSAQTSLLTLEERPAQELLKTPTHKSIFQETDLSRIRTIARQTSSATSACAYQYQKVIKEEVGHGNKAQLYRDFYEEHGWTRGTFFKKASIGRWIAENPETDITNLTETDILRELGTEKPKQIQQKNLIKSTSVPTNSAIFKAQIVALKDENEELRSTIEELRAELDEAQSAGLELVEQLQDAHETIQEFEQDQ
jgi:hypothetical protein